LARLVLDARTLAEPAAGAYPREGHRLAGLRNGADLYQSRDHACPMVECIAPVAHIGALGELPLDHAASGALQFVRVEFARPDGVADNLVPAGHPSPRQRLPRDDARPLRSDPVYGRGLEAWQGADLRRRP